MGEVRTRVRLTNAVDEDLARRGQMPAADVRSYEADALVDTGAVRLILPAQVVEQLGLAIRGQRVAEYADGSQAVVGVTGPVVADINGRNMLSDALVLGDEVIVGQVVLETLDLFVDPVNRRLFPNPAHPDQPVNPVK